MDALAELNALERDVKECERRIRFSRSFDAIMDYFEAMATVRKFEADLRDKLIADLAFADLLAKKVHDVAVWGH